MTLTASAVRVAVTGGAYRADPDAELPTDATTALGSPWEELGYVTEDGITQTIDSDTEPIGAWQGGTIVRRIMTSHELTYGLSLLETSEATLAAYYGNHADGVTVIRAEEGVRGKWCFHIVDGIYRIRVAIPDGQVTERGDVEYVNGGAINYPITISCYEDEHGVKGYLYLASAGSA